jgi:hypothetical protein
MTVDADDLTFPELLLESTKRGSDADHVGDICALRLQVVELEYPDVAFAAIRTGMAQQEIINVPTGRLASPPAGQPCLVSMELTSRDEVRAITVPAPPLTSVGMPIEAGGREIL